MKAIWKFHLDLWYGVLYGIFVAKESELQDLVGKHIMYGEVNGKHSEVIEEFNMDQVTKVTDDDDAVRMFEEHGMEVGYCPLDYDPFEYDEDDSDENLDEDED